jgi:uncharacterized protein YidB (DUF937 family)
MSKSTPSLLALLGLVAFAGYQNRDRISDMLADARKSAGDGQANPEQGNFLAEIGQTLQSGIANSGLPTALRELVDRFKSAGRGAAAESWVSTEANHPVNVDDLEDALGDDTLADLTQKTGLSRAELLLRLNVALPEVVNKMTPHGRLPASDAPLPYA